MNHKNITENKCLKRHSKSKHRSQYQQTDFKFSNKLKTIFYKLIYTLSLSCNKITT